MDSATVIKGVVDLGHNIWVSCGSPGLSVLSVSVDECFQLLVQPLNVAWAGEVHVTFTLSCGMRGCTRRVFLHKFNVPPLLPQD